MKTLLVRRGAKIDIRAIASENENSNRDRCETLKFLKEQKEKNLKAQEKLTALLTNIATKGDPRNSEVFKKLTNEIYEFRAGVLRLFAFKDGAGLIICNHGLVKKTQKTPTHELDRAISAKKAYFQAKSNGTLTHANSKREQGGVD